MKTDMVRRYDSICKRAFQQALVTPENKESLQAVFTALGIARVVRGARALYGGSGGWHACFLALAYGEPGELQRMIPNPRMTLHDVSRILEISAQDVKILIHHFDLDPEHFTSELVQWLRSRGADATTVMAFAACERGPAAQTGAQRQVEAAAPAAAMSFRREGQ